MQFRRAFFSGDLGLVLDQSEQDAISSIGDVLLGDDFEAKKAVVNGFLTQNGNFEGVSCTCNFFMFLEPVDGMKTSSLSLDTRLAELTEQGLNPPRAPTPVQEEVSEESQESEDPVDVVASIDIHAEISVSGVPAPLTNSNSFHFMQASELETPSFEENVEWVEAADAQDAPLAAQIINGLLDAVEPQSEVRAFDSSSKQIIYCVAAEILASVVGQRTHRLGS